MKYGIVGSRRRKDRESVIAFVRSLPAGSVVISGGCRGVDTWAVAEAKAQGLETIEFLPGDLTGCRELWEFTEKYYARNKQIAEACDVLVAFVTDDRSGGTENTIQHAQRVGKTVIVKSPRN